jgi:exodeoxyribonuclease V alpha subunit
MAPDAPAPHPRDPAWHGLFEPLDVRFAEALERLVPGVDPWVLVAAAAASRALQRGDICLDLAHAARTLHPPERALSQAVPPLLPADAWAERLARSPLVSDGSRRTPLVLQGYRLYLMRYFDYQGRFARAIRARLQRSLLLAPARLATTLQALFDHDTPPDDPRRRAVELALSHALTIISGGPGTGKTTTVLRLLAAILSATDRPQDVAIALAAPTGKAAARMSEAIRDGLSDLQLPEAVRARIPTRATTIHRLLVQIPRVENGPSETLAADVVVVDEASMIDLALMTRLIEAVRPDARLVLLGDKDQLASVQAGRVLVDLVGAASDDGPLAGHVVQFTRTHRFGGTIGALAEAIRDGHLERAQALLGAGDPAIEWVDLQPSATVDRATRLWAPFFDHVQNPLEALEALPRFQVLTAHRRGPWGAQTLAAAIRQRLAEDGHIRHGNPWDEWFHGRTVLVTANDQALQLWNGDVGVAMIGDDGRRLVHFPRHDDPGATRALAIGQLPPTDAWWAATIHKAQGSGFDHVMVVLPADPSPLCTRELLYTAVTRARQRVTIVSSARTLAHAISTPTIRASGLTPSLFRGEGY